METSTKERAAPKTSPAYKCRQGWKKRRNDLEERCRGSVPVVFLLNYTTRVISMGGREKEACGMSNLTIIPGDSSAKEQLVLPLFDTLLLDLETPGQRLAAPPQ